MPTPDTQTLRRAFDLAEIEERSLSPWASVHRARTIDGQLVVVKRTAPDGPRAAAMADWTRALAAAGLPVVTPVDLVAANPREVPADSDGDSDGGGDTPDWWVVYPYVAGRAYAGTPEDVRAAGDLLGRLHAVELPAVLADRLRPYAWTEATREDLERDLSTLDTVFAQHVPDRAGEASRSVRSLAERWWTSALPALLAADEAEPLPRAGVTSDYKAANLVWATGAERPVLVDPDNGGFEPRVLDLALALVLFHHECPTAPGRLLTTEEWERFATAYLRHVDLTEREREVWPAALDHMLWEEGTWALEDNDAAAWADPRQGAQLLDLALASPERYPLP